MDCIDQVIILGAGASKSEGIPLLDELFGAFIKNHSREKQSELILDFFLDFWGIGHGNFRPNMDFPSFEECLGILDWAQLRGESFKGYNTDKIDKIRSNLLYLIAKVLNENLKESLTNHENLTNRLKSENKLDRTSFISLNYDVIIDKVIANVVNDYSIDYGINLTNCYKDSYRDKNIKIFKIHGSLNWLYCSTCNHLSITSSEQKAINTFYEIENCNQCDTPMKPVIIPPTLYKEMTNPFIQQIFFKCDQILRTASKIFFCGYSFSESDMHIKYLLKRAELFNGDTPEIHVVNFHEGKVNMQEEEERFLRFFKNKKNVHYHKNLTFETFAKKGL
jgi:hypothetical protein